MTSNLNERNTPKLNYGRKGNKSREFSEIPVIAYAANGYGDMMMALNLAEGLSQEFPKQEVCVYLSPDGYRKAGKIYPNFDSTQDRQKVNGIAIAQRYKYETVTATDRQRVSISTSSNMGPTSDLEEFLQDSEVNLYLQEYDIDGETSKPGKTFDSDQTGFGGLESKTVYQDNGKRKHIILPTGFDREGLGIILDEELKESVQRDDEVKKFLPNRWSQSLWDERPWLGGKSIAEYLDNPNKTANSTWGFVYASPFYSNDRNLVDGLDALIKAYLQTQRDLDKDVTIFDFNSFESDQVKFGWARDAYRGTPFKHIFISEEGYTEVQGIREFEGSKRPNVEIVHLGNQSHDVFLEFLRASELPPVITGDLSLSEVVSMGKPFVYDARIHKRGIIPGIVDFANHHLKSEDATRISQIFSSRWDDETFRLEYDSGLRQIFNPKSQGTFQRLSDRMYQNGNIVTNLSILIRKLLDLKE